MPTYVKFNDDLSCEVDNLWTHALGERTQATYRSGLNCFQTFVLMSGFHFPSNSLPPISEDLLINFVTHCQKALHLKFETIKLYLAGIRFHYIKNKMGDPTANTLRLSYILRAIKKTQINSTLSRLPITCTILAQMCALFKNHIVFNTFFDCMLQCVYKTAFYGFLRCGEFTCNSFHDMFFLRVSDVQIAPDLSFFKLHLRVSKTDPFAKGVTITIFENSLMTPVASMRSYLNLRLSQGALPSAPLFVNDLFSSKPLLRHTFMSYLKETLARIGLENESFTGHSFRIGASTSAAAAKVEDHVIKALGRWTSDCFIRYIRISPDSIKHAQVSMTSV